MLFYRISMWHTDSFKLKMHQNPFSAGDLLRTPLKELTTPPRSRSRGEEDIPSQSPPLYAFGVSISAPTVLCSPDIFLRKNPGLMQLLASTCSNAKL